VSNPFGLAAGTVNTNMLDASLPPLSETSIAVGAGAVLLRRGDRVQRVAHLTQGRVLLGVMFEGRMSHQLGTVEGPCWLEPAAVLLGLPYEVDALAETSVELRYVAVPQFLAEVQVLTETAQDLLMDLARSQRQQTEMAVSRLAKDADARCAEWLLRHAEPIELTGGLVVKLAERKRTIAAQLGIAPETFSRVLRHLRERQLISGSGRVLGLPNPQALRKLAGV
jgi:CRP-like cAMP-binding protein